MNAIKIFRDKSGYTQKEIADKLNIDVSSVSKWETDEAMPRADKLLKLAEIFGCTVDELLREPQQESA